MSEHKIGRLLKGVDMNVFWYCLAVGKQNRNVKIPGKVNQIKLHKKYKEEKLKKEKKEKEKKDRVK